MKNKFILLALGLFIMSCSNDDNNTSEAIVEETTPLQPEDNFMPDSIGNFWVYETQSDQGNGRDSLFIANDTLINNTGYKKYKTGGPATGLYSTMITAGAVRKSEGKILVSGNLNLASDLGLPVSFDVSDFIIFDNNATANQELSAQAGVITQDMDGAVITINYTLTSIAKQAIANYTAAENSNYTNVKPVKMRLNLRVSVIYNGFPIELMPMQDVLISTQYYSEGIGVVHVTSDLNYELIDLSGFGIELPVPQSGNIQQQEVLVNYNIQ